MISIGLILHYATPLVLWWVNDAVILCTDTQVISACILQEWREVKV